MKDRISKYPGRVKLVPVSGQTDTYDMTRADEPTEEGTPLSKANLLTDMTASAIGVDGDSATVNGALAAVNTKADGKAPAYTYGATDLTAGTTALATGTMHLVYE